MDKKKPATKKATPAPKKAAPKKKATKKEPPKKAGRPEVYTQELADKLCEAIATSQKSLRTICSQKDMPSVATVLKWLREDTNGFAAQYARAKEEQADLLVEDMIDIADDGKNDLMEIKLGRGKTMKVEDREVTNRSKLRVETRKWIASKLKPKKYGDKLDVTNTQKVIIVETSEDDGE